MLLLYSIPVHAQQTWWIRSDGGTRFSANVPTGNCDGLADAPYPGTGINAHCAYSTFKYLYDDDSGSVGSGAWVIAGGDTVVVRGCTADTNEQFPHNPACRIGWGADNGGSTNNWCKGVGSFTCYWPPIPAGTSGQHTKILGQCAYGTYTCTPITPANFPYTTSNLTTLFAGFSLQFSFNFTGTQYVDVEGIEFTNFNRTSAGTAFAGTHSYSLNDAVFDGTYWQVVTTAGTSAGSAPSWNATVGGTTTSGGAVFTNENWNCTRSGSPGWPAPCNGGSQPIDDYADNGVFTDHTSANLLFQDVYVHGLGQSGFDGEIGGIITLTRVFIGFNGFAGWNFDHGNVANGTGSQLLQSYVTMMGNGCYEQSPILTANRAFPARACYDGNSAGFGDSWSGQDTNIDNITCDHCLVAYNTKDGWIGPHAAFANMSITNSAWYGNSGQAWKYGGQVNATALLQNNYLDDNCTRMAVAIPGSAQGFGLGLGIGGAYLSNFCRAGGNIIETLTQPGAVYHYYGNTFVLNGANGLQFDCGPAGGGGTNCNTSVTRFIDNIFLTYSNPANGAAPNQNLYTINAGTNITLSTTYAIEIGALMQDACGGTIICSDPLLTNEPALTWPAGGVQAFDVLPANFRPTISSPAIAAGTAVSGLTTDYFGATRPNPPSIGAAEPAGAVASPVKLSGKIVVSGSVKFQ